MAFRSSGQPVGMIQSLKCAPCMVEHPGDGIGAMTVHNGNAVCYEHFEAGVDRVMISNPERFDKWLEDVIAKAAQDRTGEFWDRYPPVDASKVVEGDRGKFDD